MTPSLVAQIEYTGNDGTVDEFQRNKYNINDNNGVHFLAIRSHLFTILLQPYSNSFEPLKRFRRLEEVNIRTSVLFRLKIHAKSNLNQ